MIINSFGYILSGFQHFFIFLMKNGYCRSSGKKYAKMVLFGLKTHFKKIFQGYFYPPTLPLQAQLYTFKKCYSSSKKYAKMVLFGLKPIFLKKFPRLFLSPNLSMQKIGSKWSLNRFLQGGALKAPPLLDVNSRGPFLQG